MPNSPRNRTFPLLRSIDKEVNIPSECELAVRKQIVDWSKKQSRLSTTDGVLSSRNTEDQEHRCSDPEDVPMMLTARYASRSTLDTVSKPVLTTRFKTIPVRSRRAHNLRPRRKSPRFPTPTEDTQFLLRGTSRTIRMDQKGVVMIDQQESPTVLESRPIQSVPDRPRSIESPSFVSGGINATSEESHPVLSFEYVEPHTIELLVVVTERMRNRFGSLLTDYLLSTLTTVSAILRHHSLKISMQLSVVDIILLDRVYAKGGFVARNEDGGDLAVDDVFAKSGVAHYRSMCNTESSCLAVLDRGFGTGYIIAHELGHQLSAKHDFERNSNCGQEKDGPLPTDVDSFNDYFPGFQGASVDEFQNTQRYAESWRADDSARRDTIMSGTLHFDNFPLRWSACSQRAVHQFLQSNAAACLRQQGMPSPLYNADYLAKRYVDDLPGAVLSLDQQCQLVLKVSTASFCGSSLPMCQQLYCQDSPEGGCSPMETAWAEGTACGEDKWCLQGECVPTSRKPVRVDGNWGDWGPWSACSKSCGGGVRFSERECNNPKPQNGGEYCFGTRTRMRSCAIQPCENPVNIRQHLCGQISQSYGTALEPYMPKIGEATACNLICLDHGRAVPHRVSLPDGTPCYPQRDDICVKGRCWETGCDGVLGSSQRFDECRVCGGDNSTCVEISGVFHGESMNSLGVHPRGLITAVHIPSGVTNAFVRKTSPRTTPFSANSYDDFMLLIFEELKTQIRRGETREPFAGAELYYSGSRRSEEIVRITGKIHKVINIVIRVENPQTTRPLPLVEYRYFVDKAQRHNPLYFVAEEEAEMAAIQEARRSGRSERFGTVTVEPVQHMEAKKRPRVYFAWRISELPSGCTSCAGNSTSHAECYPMLENEAERSLFSEYDFYHPVADRLCSSVPRPAPVFRRCADYCGVRWSVVAADSDHGDAGRETACSARCGGGRQRVTHICEEYVVPAEQQDKSKGLWRPAQLGEWACVKAGLGNAPPQPTYVACQGSCSPVFWIPSNWSECSDQCGYGERHRSITCQEESGRKWPLRECVVSGEQSAVTPLTFPNRIDQSTTDLVLSHLTKSHLKDQLQDSLTFDQYEACMSLEECKSQVQWSTTQWSDCQPLTEEMQSVCRSLGETSTGAPHGDGIIGMRQRQVYCLLLVPQVPSSMSQYVIDEGRSSGPPWRMQMEFCRKATNLIGLVEEPPGREPCNQPFCFRWGEAKLGQCSATCGVGTRPAYVPCERIRLNLQTFDVQTPDRPAYEIEEVSLTECHNHLGYTPRILLSSDNQSVFVETLERSPKEKLTTEVRSLSPSEPFYLTCVNTGCEAKLPAWHTTSWSKCSVTCGYGTRSRRAICMLETHNESPKDYQIGSNYDDYAMSYATIQTSNKLRTEAADPKMCEDAQLPKPAEEETCLEGPCPQWMPGEWGPCEGVCEYGIQRRQIECVLDLSPKRVQHRQPVTKDGDKDAVLFASPKFYVSMRHKKSKDLVPVETDRCRNAGPKPPENRVCLISSGCPYWHASEWSQCSVDCGVGVRRRSVDCRYPNGTVLYSGSGVNIWNSQTYGGMYTAETDISLKEIIRDVTEASTAPRCRMPTPVEETSCKTRICTGPEPFWWTVMISKCDSETCDVEGRQNRAIKCLSSSLGQIDEMACKHLERPKDWIPCVPFRCKTFHWTTDAWSKCPNECGFRTRYRRARCVDNIGDEYSDSVCPAHLKPSVRDVCTDLCTNMPRSCKDIKQRHPSATDDIYSLLIGQTQVSIYCADMNTDNPKEYITLRRVNIARAAAFLPPTSYSSWCLANMENPFSKLTNTMSNDVDTTDHWLHERMIQQEVSAVNCKDCHYIRNLASVTYYQKIRLNIKNLQVDIEDTRFAYTVGPSAIPFGTAKDCFGSTGYFQIDLSDTGFRVSAETHWTRNVAHSAAHIHRSQAHALSVLWEIEDSLDVAERKGESESTNQVKIEESTPASHNLERRTLRSRELKYTTNILSPDEGRDVSSEGSTNNYQNIVRSIHLLTNNSDRLEAHREECMVYRKYTNRTFLCAPSLTQAAQLFMKHDDCQADYLNVPDNKLVNSV
ncbi:unnamed protein product [Calicophoron daubneyi]|uniref:A disintegrin and metalloproteinase with thrombospondin motifs 9 n=1 Tax=Calicophoron daubneyi TaxID=300641 RepID=A0AAV2TJT3_CALDB